MSSSSPKRALAEMDPTNAQEPGTRLDWVQEFRSAEAADRMRSICEPANEQNLDWLETVLNSVST